MKRLIECVPNFSEGRDPAKVDAIVEAMRSVPGVYVLDQEMDADHNRCVITLAGEPDAVGEAAIAGRGPRHGTDRHERAHGRAPARGRDGRGAVYSHRGRDASKIAWRWPGASATKSGSVTAFRSSFMKRRRRGRTASTWKMCGAASSKGCGRRLKKNHDRQPDVGEPKLHPTAGVTVVGARKFLIAYNVNLNTPDVGIANKIAKAIRFSSGGLRYVKSMGVELKARNLAQVSINLTDFEQTPMHRVYEMVKREAERYGAVPVGSEIVGLVPKKAIEMAADYFLQLENFSPAQVFENKLEAVLGGAPAEAKEGKLANLARPFLDAVAEPTATPGGGSVSALAAGLAAALGQMVAGLSRKKKSQILHVDKLSEHLDALRRTADELTEAIDRDAASYDAVMAAFKLPQGNAEETRAAREKPYRRRRRARRKCPWKWRKRRRRCMSGWCNWRPSPRHP